MESIGEGPAVMAELLYAETVRRMNFQLQNLSGLRARASTLFGAATVATSLLAGLAKTAESAGQPLRLGVAGWVAVASFLVAMTITLAMFGNIPRLRFTLPRRAASKAAATDTAHEGVEDLLSKLASLPIASRADAYKDMTKRLELLYKENARTMSWLFALMYALVAAVGIELAAWLVVLT